MHDTLTLKRHATLVDRMANTLGLDLEERVFRGDLSIPAIGDAVLRCTGCTGPGACARWMDTEGQMAEATPDYCRNAEMFQDLKHGRRVD